MTALERLNIATDNLTLAVGALVDRVGTPSDGLSAADAESVASRIDALTDTINTTLTGAPPLS